MRVSEGTIRDILRLIVWFPLRWLVRIIPVDLSFFLFKLMGDLHFCVGGEKKKRLLHNIKTILSKDRSARDIVKKYYENHYIDRLHIFLYPKLTSDKIKKYVYFENIEVLERELKNSKGVLLVQPHFGPVQITLLSLALYGFSPIQIGYPTDTGLSKIGRFVAFRTRLKYEALLPAPIIPADRYLGKAYKHLAKGGVVLTTGDGAGVGVFLGVQEKYKIFGIERMFPLGPAMWAIKTRAAFVPTFIIPETYKKFKIVFENPIGGIYNNFERDRGYMTEKFIAIAEEYTKKYPHCWHFLDEI
jgi:KDO2-lipid IV(A) lauroyltransferase